MSDDAGVRKLILVPALITLGVTLLRLAGELLDWAPALFSREPGGGAALVGIAWLVPVFGAWFGWKLVRAGTTPPRVARALATVVLAFALIPAAGIVAARLGIPQESLTTLWIFAAVAVVSAFVGMAAWPPLGRVLLVYGLAARVPVALVMLAAILANWGTHYDVAPSADFPAMSPLAKWFTIGLVPQLSIWIAFTIVIGGLCGIVAAAIAARRPAAA